MAVGTSFKQQCPSCEALIPIRDPAMIGKKVECPKCKDRFIVESPADGGKKKIMDDDDAPKANGKANGKPTTLKGAGSPKTELKKSPKRFRDDGVDKEDEAEDSAVEESEEDAPVKPARGKADAKKPRKVVPDEEEVDEVDEAELKKLASKGKKKVRDDSDEDEDEDKASKKKSKARANKYALGLALAVVGLVVLAVAAFFMFRGGPSSTDKQGVAQKPNTSGIPPNPGADPPNDTGTPQNKDFSPKRNVDFPLTGPGAELTNLLPNDTEHVFHVAFKDLLDPDGLLRDAAFRPGTTLDNEDLRKKLGFSILAIDDLIQTERFTAPAWSFTVVHSAEPLDVEALTKALGLKAVAPGIKNYAYFQATQPNPWFERLARFSLGVPRQLGSLPKLDDKRPLFVHVHDPQTLIFADEKPMVAFLEADKQFRVQPPPTNPNPMGKSTGKTPGSQPGKTPATDPKADPMAHKYPKDPKGDPMAHKDPMPHKKPMDNKNVNPTGTPTPPSVVLFATGTYSTIKPALKATLDRMEIRADEMKDKVLFSTATDLEAARLLSPLAEHKGKTLYQPRQTWDVTYLLQERNFKLRTVGAGLVQRDPRIFTLRQELGCSSESEAKELNKVLVEDAAPTVARFFHRFLGAKVELPKTEDADPTDPKGPSPKGPYPKGPYPTGAGPYPTGPSKGPYPTGAGPGPTAPSKGPYPTGAGPYPTGPSKGPYPMGAGPYPTAPSKGPYPAGSSPYPMDPMGRKFFPPPGKGLGEPEIDELPTQSRILVSNQTTAVDFNLDLVFDFGSFAKLHDAANHLAYGLRTQLDLAGGASSRHDLAKAGKLLGEKGLSERGLPPGQYLPGAFKRAANSRLAGEPSHRISWMAGLLPFLGHENLYTKINFDASWRDPSNWVAANTVVPSFLDPMYPAGTQFTSRFDIPFDLAATHFVGIAGVGLDAADYLPGNPATQYKRGVLGYEKGASLKEIQEGRGLSNTILLIQVPHDGQTGPTPWIAGGGSTLRGIPEKNSIAPFLLSTDKNGKPIQHKGKRGTYALMVDGSVRFLDQNIEDEVFQAMATVQGPTPPDFNLNANENTPLVPVPKPGTKEPVRTEAPATAPDPTAAPKPAAAQDAPQEFKLLEGTWRVITLEVDGKVQPTEMSPKQIVISGNKLTGIGPEMRLTLDATKKPKWVDLTFQKAEKDYPIRAIYEIDGDDLKLCMPLAAKDKFENKRPEGFESAGKPVAVFKAKRIGK